MTHPGGQLGFQDGGPRERAAGGRRPAREQLFRADEPAGEDTDVGAQHPEVLAALRGAVLDHTRRTAWGVHLRCTAATGAPLRLRLETVLPVAEIKPMSLEGDDEIAIAPTRQRIDLALTAAGPAEGEDEDWWIVRSLEPGLALTLATAGGSCKGEFRASDTAQTGDGAAAPPVELCGCAVWSVPHPSRVGSAAIDDAALERLRGLGYVR
jgi:hypothetical protein